MSRDGGIELPSGCDEPWPWVDGSVIHKLQLQKVSLIVTRGERVLWTAEQKTPHFPEISVVGS